MSGPTQFKRRVADIIRRRGQLRISDRGPHQVLTAACPIKPTSSLAQAHGSATGGDHFSTQKIVQIKGHVHMSTPNLEAMRTNRKLRRLLSVLFMMMVIGPVAGVSEAAELYTPRGHKRSVKRSFDYPYGGSYLIGNYYASRSLGSPYVGKYFGNYYGPYTDYYSPYGGAFYTFAPCIKRAWPCH